MSQEKVETVRRITDAWNRGNAEGWMAPIHPEVEWSSAVLREVEGHGAVRRGPSEIRQFWDEWHATWDLQIELSETRDLGDTIVALGHMKSRGRSSGAETQRPVAYVFVFEGGMIRRATAYLTHDEALTAVGLCGEA